MRLTVTGIKKVKPGPKPRKLFDGGGLFLLVQPSGGKWWRLKYRYGGKEKLLAFGTFPDIGLVEARERRERAKKQLRAGIDPSENRKALKAARFEQSANSFELIAREWVLKKSPAWSEAHAKRTLRRLEQNLFPWLGSRSIEHVTAPDLLAAIRRIEAKGALDTAHRALQNCGQIFRYAVATGRAERDPSGDLRGALSPVKTKHHASITDPKGVAALMRAINGYQGQPVTVAALRIAPLVFVRPGELRKAEWIEFDFGEAEWRIPAERMKMPEQHLVPLSRQASTILRELEPLTGSGRYVFPSIRTDERPMSENTINAALRRLGYSTEEMTGHGFRSMASTLLNEQGWNRDAIERQLAHGERNAVRAAYNYAEQLPERRKMMQAWADYLDGLQVDKWKS